MWRIYNSIWLGLLLPLTVAACGESGSYELHWTIGCTQTPLSGCALKSVKQCSSVGLDAMVVQALRNGVEEDRAIFPCYSLGEGALGRGPGLDPGEITLKLSGQSPGGQTLSGPVSTTVTIAEIGLTEAWLNLPTPPACNDGVDNDGDGQVDLGDSDCKDSKDTDEKS